MNYLSKKYTTNVTNHKGLPMFMQKFFALAGLLSLSPFLLILGVCIKLESKGSIIFSQLRVGEHGRQFKCYKFRSMYLPGSEQWREAEKMKSDREGICQKMYSDPRITKIGRIIRKLSIDELPQLFNVLKGDMALVGPRPHLTTEYVQYSSDTLVRLHCKPGLTGLWQVSGRADTTFEEQLELDRTYIANQSWYFDMKILVATVPAVLMAKGAY